MYSSSVKGFKRLKEDRRWMKCIFIARFEVNEKRTRTKKKKKKRKISQSSVKNKEKNSIHDLASNDARAQNRSGQLTPFTNAFKTNTHTMRASILFWLHFLCLFFYYWFLFLISIYLFIFFIFILHFITCSITPPHCSNIQQQSRSFVPARARFKRGKRKI